MGPAEKRPGAPVPGSASSDTAAAPRDVTDRDDDLLRTLDERGGQLRAVAQREGLSLVRFLGAGGMGEVWLAQETGSGRQVAVKTLKSPLSEAQAAALSREVSAASRLDHPWIVGPLRFLAGPPACVVLEYVDGLPLSEALPAGEGAVRLTVHLFAMIADALKFAHDRGVIHGDLKPGNVLVTADFTPRILDFGLAHLAGTAIPSQQNGGTRGYSPPELRDPNARAGPWTDTYSLSVLLLEALTATAQESRQPIPWGLRRILKRGLARSPRRRYRDAGDFARDLRRWLRIPWLAPALTRRTLLTSTATVLAAGERQLHRPTDDN